MPRSVLDASAILALLQGEAGAARVAESLAGGVVSAVNLSEVASRLADHGLADEAIAGILADLALEVALFDEAQAIRAARLRPASRSLGLSLGDRACLALAESLSLPALTADRAWKDLKLAVEVELIR